MSSLNLSEMVLPESLLAVSPLNISVETIIFIVGFMLISLFALVLGISNLRGLSAYQRNHAFKSLLISILASVIPPLAIMLFYRTARYVLTVEPAAASASQE
ncbi:hypothetical protein GCM10009425_41240 [Pseudomonas asuensis]|uniref:Uncharacterized protein n=1 Tax=Pseudomonas asuensis TaxID=1825787 RepID=A0ABQ2H2U5_9PSED|nr:hypothetical protein GCM10009425_41240 [Pseudomonas asuensis]